MYNYESLLEQLQRKNPRKLANNTRISLSDNIITVTYHDSDIVKLQSDKITLDSCGWMTYTTKERFNWFMPRGLSVYQNKKIWYIWDYSLQSKVSQFYNGITLQRIRDNWIVNNPKNDNEQEILSRKALKFVNAFIAHFMAGKIPTPGNGDCFYCHMHEVRIDKPLGDTIGDNDHILSHINEKYYVPSLLANAILENKNKLCIISQDGLSRMWQDWKSITSLDAWQREVMERDIKSCLKSYVYKRLGLAN